jgi:CelD/BcsL family acetyltransferase involved in cellulose biosynthesis
MEALAAGTPVIAFKTGALLELVDDGRTGFLVDGPDDMAAAINEVDTISPDTCRAYARDHFSSSRMTRDYLDLYARLSRPAVSIRSPRRAEVREAFPSWYREVFDASRTATPFQSPDWIEPWWDIFGNGDPLILSVDGEGVLPLYRDGGTVQFMGAGVTDYLDLIARPGEEMRVAQGCADYLAANSGGLRYDLDEVPSSSALLAMQMPASVVVRLVDSSYCPVLDLTNWSVPARLAKNLRYSQRKLSGNFQTYDSSRSQEFVDQLIGLHEARWEEGIFADVNVERFHRTTLPKLAAAGLARMHVLARRSQVIAALYCLAKGDTTYYYIGGFDPEFESYSPGSLLIDYAIQEARREGHRVFDFLRGSEPYKYGWGATNRINKRLIICSTDIAVQKALATGRP